MSYPLTPEQVADYKKYMNAGDGKEQCTARDAYYILESRYRQLNGTAVQNSVEEIV